MREEKICLTKMMKECGHEASFYGQKPSKTTKTINNSLETSLLIFTIISGFEIEF